jgi:hypothetical protein
VPHSKDELEAVLDIKSAETAEARRIMVEIQVKLLFQLFLFSILVEMLKEIKKINLVYILWNTDRRFYWPMRDRRV